VNSVVESNTEEAYSDQYKAYKGLQKGFKMMDYEGYLYPHRVIFGDPDQCVARIREIQSTGVTNVSLLANFGGLEHTKVLASLDRFAQYVMPKFQ
jgi:alkanesulfonate monooxygenase SsuD/methylene tetrahydromethanopterin reductase-like flavin-dependent oxidoreductase (luciferase family)